MNSYEGHCGMCEYFKGPRDTNQAFDLYYAEKERGYCEWYKSYYWASDSSIHYRKRGSYRSDCYITTVVCNILGYDDHCGILESMRKFRNDVMQKEEKYASMLWEYDTVGPKIAQSLENDYHKTGDCEFAVTLFNFYIQPTSRFIDEQQYDEAVSRYQEMTHALADFYGISPSLNIPEEYDHQRGGHGIVRKKALGTYPRTTATKK